MTYSIVNPKVEIINYGPTTCDEDGQVIMTPDICVALSSQMTFNNMNANQNLERILREDKDLKKTVFNTLVGSIGRGHASGTTTSGFWVLYQDCTKMIDSYGTGAIFSSSLMPSGRRTGINREQIMIPTGIAKASPEIQQIYIQASEKNIDTYEKLIQRGIKQDAAGKIVQYGIMGGGLEFLPLETFVSFAQDCEFNRDAIPEDVRTMISQIKGELNEMGMPISYSARINAARSPYPNPTIFKFNNDNYIAELWKNNLSMARDSQIILIDIKTVDCPKRDELFKKLNVSMGEYLKDPKKIQENWRRHLFERDQLIKAYNSTVNVHTATNVPWRVWGEIKRHRTMEQNPESIYAAVERTLEEFRDIKMKDNSRKSLEEISYQLDMFISIPEGVRKDPENIRDWLMAFDSSLEAYDSLIKRGVAKSDALQIIPRGIKFGVEKNADLFNLIDGYYPLRSCNTAEEEMLRITRREIELIKASKIPGAITDQIRPKCGYVGFCLEPWSKCCHQINQFVGFEYDEEIHKNFDSARKDAINKTLTELRGPEDIN